MRFRRCDGIVIGDQAGHTRIGSGDSEKALLQGEGGGLPSASTCLSSFARERGHPAPRLSAPLHTARCRSSWCGRGDLRAGSRSGAGTWLRCGASARNSSGSRGTARDTGAARVMSAEPRWGRPGRVRSRHSDRAGPGDSGLQAKVRVGTRFFRARPLRGRCVSLPSPASWGVSCRSRICTGICAVGAPTCQSTQYLSHYFGSRFHTTTSSSIDRLVGVTGRRSRVGADGAGAVEGPIEGSRMTTESGGGIIQQQEEQRRHA